MQKAPLVRPTSEPRPETDSAPQKGCPKLIGYIRVSTDDQKTAMQTDAMQKAACDVVYEEYASGSDRSRPVLAEALAALNAGDTLVIWKLDRLGRSLGHLCEVSADLRKRGVFLRSLTDGFDTSTPSGRLYYNILGSMAEFEREIIVERTIDGMKAAKKRGVHVGRPHALAGSRLTEAKRMLDEGKSQVETARILRISRATLQRALQAQIGA